MNRTHFAGSPVPPFTDRTTQETKPDSWSQGVGWIFKASVLQPWLLGKSTLKLSQGQDLWTFASKSLERKTPSLWANTWYFYTPFLTGNKTFFFNDLQKFLHLLDIRPLSSSCIAETFSKSVYYFWCLLLFFFIALTTSSVVIEVPENNVQISLLPPAYFITYPSKVVFSYRTTVPYCTQDNEQEFQDALSYPVHVQW